MTSVTHLAVTQVTFILSRHVRGLPQSAATRYYTVVTIEKVHPSQKNFMTYHNIVTTTTPPLTLPLEPMCHHWGPYNQPIGTQLSLEDTSLDWEEMINCFNMVQAPVSG
uniref:Uncharacterized protein n=1 Tax=Vitis vinifera TaxID=29760 RepID=F6H443_VITVI